MNGKRKIYENEDRKSPRTIQKLKKPIVKSLKNRFHPKAYK